MSDKDKAEENLAETVYLDTKDLSFSLSSGGFLSMSFKDTDYSRVHLYRIFPLSLSDGYISVRDHEDKEIGIIESTEGMPREHRMLIEDEIASRYFTPVIERIISLKEEFGYSYWEVDTNSGVCRFTVHNRHNPVLQLEGKRILITDVDGNRFEIEDYTRTEVKHLRIIETML